MESRVRTDDTYMQTKKYLTYQNMFYLFMAANIVGVLMEGIWTSYKFHRWETHTVTIWGPFCLIYGVAAVALYFGKILTCKRNILMQFVIYAAIANTIEYLCAWMIEDGLHLRAWTYEKHFMNLQGRICLQMTIMWGVIGIVYSHLLIPKINVIFEKMKGKFWRPVCIGLTIFMFINMGATILCLIRWSSRHEGKKASNQLETMIDSHYNDQCMQKIFCEWWFIDEQKEFWKIYKNRNVN